MKITDQEHYELMDMFERDFKGCARMDREDKSLWRQKQFYQHGEVNKLFLAYRYGYSLGKCVQRQHGDIE